MCLASWRMGCDVRNSRVRFSGFRISRTFITAPSTRTRSMPQGLDDGTMSRDLLPSGPGLLGALQWHAEFRLPLLLQAENFEPGSLNPFGACDRICVFLHRPSMVVSERGRWQQWQWQWQWQCDGRRSTWLPLMRTARLPDCPDCPNCLFVKQQTDAAGRSRRQDWQKIGR